MTKTSHAPWYSIPSEHRRLRDLANSTIVEETLDDTGLEHPPTRVDLAHMRAGNQAAEQRRGIPGAKVTG
jgi:hypothetical protein